MLRATIDAREIRSPFREDFGQEMSGLLALLDDVVALMKVAAVTIDDAAGQAARASGKAAGVVIDDAAVTPRFVAGLAAHRELPIVGRIAVGSLKNKLLILLPLALALSYFLPQAITPLLMIGGLYLCLEGQEKVQHMVSGQPHVAAAAKAALQTAEMEEVKVAGAIRTDFVLSAEIMAIALASIEAPDLVTRALALAAVAVMVTAGVYGTVALIVKADDLGVRLALRNGSLSGPIGRGLVHAMPTLLSVLSFVGMLAMLWVGGGILIHGLAELGMDGPEHLLETAAHAIGNLAPVGGDVLSWLVSAAAAGVIGLAAGALTQIVVRLSMAPFRA
jgi:predicted DNA repair protein MutK